LALPQVADKPMSNVIPVTSVSPDSDARTPGPPSELVANIGTAAIEYAKSASLLQPI
jgi:hypothetical protein